MVRVLSKQAVRIRVLESYPVAEGVVRHTIDLQVEETYRVGVASRVELNVRVLAIEMVDEVGERVNTVIPNDQDVVQEAFPETGSKMGST